MQNPSPTCGNCGKPVSATDITCPHCDALLAAYASPVGSITPHVYDPEAPVAEAFATADMSVPAPAAPITIPDSVEAVSSAPRPLFDTQLTVEDIARAAESEHDEPLVVVKDENATTSSAAFNVPDYARPPADAAPVPMLEDIEAGTIAQPVEPKPHATPKGAPATSPPAPKTIRNNAASPPPEDRGESWLYDLSRNAPTPQPTKPVRERKNRPEPVRTTTLPPTDQRDRGRTENYLRKLHEQTGYDGNSAQLSQPVETRKSWAPMTTTRRTKADDAKLEKSRQGCSVLLIAVLFFMWLGVIGGIVTGDVNPGLLMVTVALTFLARFLRKPFPSSRQK